TQGSNGPCVQNLCYAETDSQDLDLAKRAKNLGMSVELTLLFDGGGSSTMPAAWANDSFSQLQTDLYNYVFQEIESYRSAGVMPDLVAIGNEVDTGFLNGYDPGTSFPNFAQLQISAMSAVRAAAADTSIGPALPAPLLCVHITPAWDLTSFFTEANSNSIPYDAICQSYYPIYHGPLTAAQAAASNPSNQPVEQTVLNSAASAIGKPIFLIEFGDGHGVLGSGWREYSESERRLPQRRQSAERNLYVEWADAVRQCGHFRSHERERCELFSAVAGYRRLGRQVRSIAGVQVRESVEWQHPRGGTRFVELWRIFGYRGGYWQHKPLPAVADLEQWRRIFSNRQRERVAGGNSECSGRLRRLDECGQSGCASVCRHV